MSLSVICRCGIKLVSRQTIQLRVERRLMWPSSCFCPPPDRFYSSVVSGRNSGIAAIPYWVKGPIRTEIYRTTSGDGLLHLSTKYKLADKDLLFLLSCLCRYKDSLKTDYLRDPRLLAILRSLKSFGQMGVKSISVGDAVFTLRSLLHLGISPAADTVVAYQNFIMRSFSRLPVDSVAVFAIFHRRFATTTALSGDLQAKMEKFIVKEGKNLKDVSLLLPLIGEDLDKLRLFEPLLLDGLSQLKSVDLCRLLATVGTLSYDSDVLVNNLTEVLCESTEPIPLKKVCACLLSCEHLSCSSKLIERLLKNVATEITAAKSVAVITTLSTALGHLKYLDKQIVTAICQWMLDNVENCQPEDFLPVVVMLGKLAFVPDSLKQQLVSVIVDKLLLPGVPSQQLRLDFVWGLAVIESLKPDFVYYFAQQDVCDQLLLQDGHPKSFTNRAKLLNIFAASELDAVAKHQAESLVEAIHASLRQAPVSQEKQQKTAWLVKALESIAPKERYLETNKITKDGYFINAELRIEANGVLIPKLQANVKDEKRIAFIVTEKCDYTKGPTTTLAGHNHLAQRHLQLRGYKVIEIKFEEVKLLNPVEKVKFLRSVFPSDQVKQVQSEKRI